MLLPTFIHSMDTITHTVLGACLGEAIAGKKLGKKAMLIGALANNIPDVDIVTSLWMNHADSLLAHRGFTHSILFVLICTPMLAAIAVRLSKKKLLSFNQWMLLFGSGLFTHIFIDAFTVYGTGWFEPFSHYRVTFNALFILDPLFTLPVLVAAVTLLVMKKYSSRRLFCARAGIGITSLYLAISILIKLHVNHKVEQSLAVQKISYSNYMTSPTPLNNLLWFIIARNAADYYIGYYSVFDKQFPISFNHVHRNDSLVSHTGNVEELDKLIRFTDGYFMYTSHLDTVSISDMRFGQMGGWYDSNAPYVFNYRLQMGADNSIELQSTRFEGNSKGAFSKLIERIKGN
ncbi:MAG TPA: metal-dependent hydrolase [Chitinophagales bacterium]|nr:metal-dependent hydrolase [Chitinophagales bacterium]